MRHSSVALMLFLTSSFALASPERLVGDFTHDFTRPANGPVWTVKKSGAEWRIFYHSIKKTVRASRADETERVAFWEQMWWPAEKAKDAECLSIKGDWPGMMCYVSSSARSGIPDLSEKKSEYFYFDSMGGLKEIRLTQK